MSLLVSGMGFLLRSQHCVGVGGDLGDVWITSIASTSLQFLLITQSAAHRVPMWAPLLGPLATTRSRRNKRLRPRKLDFGGRPFILKG